MPGISDERIEQWDFPAGLAQLAGHVAESQDPAADASAPEKPQTLDFESCAECEPPTKEGLFSVVDPACPSEYREQFRLLRTQLLLHRTRFEHPEDFRTVSIMSTHKGEGKSFTASNLAAVLAITGGQRVLLIDVDTASSPIPVGAPMPEGAGLLYALSAPSDWARATFRIKNTPLYLMGRDSSRTSRLIDFEPLPRLLAVLREQFDWIILDGSAFASSPEAPWLSAVTDGTLLVVQQNAASFGAVHESLSRIMPERLVGVVFNHRKRDSKVRLRVRIKRAGSSR